MGKDRLKELQDFNPQAKYSPVLQNVTTDQEKDASEFLEELDQTRRWIDKIKSNIEKISELHNQKLASVSEAEGKRCSKSIDSSNDEITRYANNIRNKLKKLGEELKKRPDKKDALYRLPYQQYANLSEQFFDCMAEYNKVQCKFKQKYRERVQRQYRIVKEDVTEEEIDAALCNETGDSIFAQEILSPGHQEAKQALEEIKDRHEEILKLEKSIRQLHQMFLDMALLVEQQGETLDHIEINVGEAEDYTEEAKAELIEAKNLNRKIRKKKIIFFIFVLIILAIIAIVL
ncbi:hypothetical protein Zmor_004106, partial [Zophobas morio]